VELVLKLFLTDYASQCLTIVILTDQILTELRVKTWVKPILTKKAMIMTLNMALDLTRAIIHFKRGLDLTLDLTRAIIHFKCEMVDFKCGLDLTLDLTRAMIDFLNQFPVG
jgi:hypothetical protein